MRQHAGLAFGLLLMASAPARADTVDVSIVGFSFAPQEVNIQVGDTVRWTNNSGNFHDVTANDGSFGNSASTSFTYAHTFDEAGTFGYYCSLHGGPNAGMSGTVVVTGGGGTGQPGTLRFSQTSYSVAESGGSASVTVQRLDGDDGAVSVQFAATAGTASAGADFTATSGTLSWADNDDSSKSFTVTVIADTAAEATETVLLALSNPGGGATIDPARQTATLQIVDDDVPIPGDPPAAPTSLLATPQSTTEVALAWTDNATNETGFLVERRTVDGTFAQVLTAGANATSAVVPALEPSTFYLFRVRASGGGGATSGYSNEATATTLGNVAPCVAGAQTLCLNDGRFRAEVAWRTASTSGRGQAVPVPSAPDSGLVYFFNAANIELLVKALDACFFDRYWVFYAATTNVEFALVVTDTQTGRTRGYYNPLDRPAPPVQDTEAFATCP
jgi:plastocyanin